MPDVEQMKKIVAFIMCEITFGQNVCELMFGVNVPNLNLVSQQVFSVTSSSLSKFQIRNRSSSPGTSALW